MDGRARGDMVDSSSHEGQFRDYYFHNKGTLFRSFEITINDFHYSYDIYWGDPNVIFAPRALAQEFPLAVTTIPRRYHYPNPRIFLHDKLERKYDRVFELVIAHEIGHLWLHDIVGFNNPATSDRMSEEDSEVWADYFSYSFFVSYRGVYSLDDFAPVLEGASNLQLQIYDLDPQVHRELTFTKKMEKLTLQAKSIEVECNRGNQVAIHMKNAAAVTLKALGDIF